MKPVTDPALLEQLNSGMKPVTDERVLFELNNGAQPRSVISGDRSIPGQAIRQIGLAARQGIEGLASLPNMVGDALGLNSSKSVGDLLTRIGLPQEEGGTERVVGDVTRAMAGQGGILGLGRGLSNAAGPVVSRVGDLLKSQPALQVVSAGTGAGAAGATREGGGGDVAQLMAGLSGAILPSVVASGAPMGVRGLLRGGEEGRQRVASNIKLFDDAGYGTPTVGQASEARLPRAIESGLSRTPGGAGRIVNAAEQGAENLGGQVDDLASGLSKGATATKAGAAIEGGIRKFADRFKGEQEFLYGKIDQHIPKGSRVDVTNTRTALESLNADIPGAPNVSELFKNARIKGIQGALKADTETTSGVASNLPAWQKQLLEQMPEVERTTMLNGLIDGKLPYEALKKLRTLVGNEISNSTIASDVPRSKWKALYGALSQDLRVAASDAGPQATKAFERANKYTSAGHTRIETYLDRVIGKDTAEKIFTAAVSPSEVKEGASTINAVMRSIEPKERDMVRAAFLKRLGTATAGRQDAAGEVFSSETFLTNWNKISPEAKMTLFADAKGTLRDDLEKIAKVAANLREGSKVFSNPSGTQQALSSQAMSGGAFVALLTGHPSVAAAIGGAALTANAASRLMTNPNFVKWLAKSTQSPVGAITSLQGVAQGMSGEDRAAVNEFMEKARQLPQPRSGQQRQ